MVNAGVYAGAPLADLTEELFDQLSDINFKGAFFSVQKALPYLNDGASIIITSSAVSNKAFGDAAVYAATKAATTSLARGLSQSLLDRKIRVNVLSPGPIETPIFGRNGASAEEVDGMKAYAADPMADLSMDLTTNYPTEANTLFDSIYQVCKGTE